MARYGPNAFRAAHAASWTRILLSQFRSILVLLLVAAAAVALATADVVDAAAIGAVLALNVMLGFVTELRAHRAMEALLALEVPRAHVLRGGERRVVDAVHLVPGDVIELDAGQSVPADARLLEAVELAADEAPLTGESVPAEKRADLTLPGATVLADRSNLVFKATAIVTGHARAVVVATGMETEVGRIGTLVAGVREGRAPLEVRLESLGRRLAAVAVGVAALVAVQGALQGAEWGRVLQTALALAVAAVPEGLPVVATIALAVGVRRMARRRALVRRLPAVETLGSATVICTDKTGTLTAGEMTVVTYWLGGREIGVTGAGYAPAGGFVEDGRALDAAADEHLAAAIRIGALANHAALERLHGAWRAIGDPTEAALLTAAGKAGLTAHALLQTWPRAGEVPFASERRWMATHHRRGTSLVACVKGAPERVVALCARWRTPGGEAPLDADARRRVLEANEELAARGLRVLALAEGGQTEGGAQRHGGTGAQNGQDSASTVPLTLIGLVGMMDPPAEGVRETVARFRGAGLHVVMLTGDQRPTAQAVARSLGLLDQGEDTLDGAEVDLLDDTALAERLGGVGAISRVSPEAKLRIVAAWQRRGAVVAMLGDGINDAAALRQAEIGVVMGGCGTDLAREAADVILQDDRFETIGVAIEHGRVIFANIRKFVFYLFSCNLAEVLVFLGAGLAGLAAPLLPLQILWLNLVTDTFPALALAAEPAEPGVMQQPPRPPRESILPPADVRDTLLFAGLIAVCTLLAYVWGDSPARATTLAFHTLALAQVLHLGNARARGPVTAPHRALANPWALGAVALVVALQVLASAWPALAGLLHLTALAPKDWLAVVILGATPGVLGQLVKALRPQE